MKKVWQVRCVPNEAMLSDEKHRDLVQEMIEGEKIHLFSTRSKAMQWAREAAKEELELYEGEHAEVIEKAGSVFVEVNGNMEAEFRIVMLEVE